MPKLKPGTILPTAVEDAAITAAAQADPDARPFTDAQWEEIKPQARRGRRLGSGSKVQVTIRLDIDTVQRLRATGAGWQTRANEVLRNWVKRHA
ncbi:MAG: BrnA antitoxin family protein [Burkholderiales bacterium]|uniref:BrnA antitoxin family protein n=1 Tax=Ottowia sp. TaxID=1898956 RepID=UPI001ACE25BA|nr:BrnA antitoxin family protein [Ottowia sp.]MBN9406660.1 BrnA antitoxin family protein [Burkholderiales bacterium]MBS0415393.1 BrnA antitoxin family protein [Pseudomonadota bacterium]HMN56309.1 BrnA antitoxin family protein [Ottowia sp.]